MIWWLAAANLMVYAAVYACQAVVPLVTHGMGGDTAVVGWVGTAFFAATMLARVPAGWIADRLGQRGPMTVGAAIVAAGAVLLASATSPVAIGVVRALQGVGLAVFTTALMPVLASIARPGALTSTLSQFGISTNAAAALSPLIGIGLFQGGRVATVFWLAAVICMVGALLALRAPAHRLPGEQPETGSVNVPWWPAAVAIDTFGITYAVHVDFVPVLGAARAIPAFGLYYTVYALAVTGTRTISGRIGDRLGQAWLVIPGAVAAAVAMALLGSATTVGQLVAAAVLYGVAGGSIHPAVLATLLERAPSARRGSASAIFYLAYDGGIALGGPAIGALLTSLPASSARRVAAICSM